MLVLQGMPTMSPVMAKALVDVSAATDQALSGEKSLRLCRSHELRLGTSSESLFIN